jgi:predicted alpha/beta-fold hydrolase
MAKRAADFRANGLLRNPHLQSLLASSGIRRWRFRHRHSALESVSTEHILDCGDGVRLQGFHARQTALPQARALVVLLHGWEGSGQSSYILNVGSRLLDEGYDVFRLNFRDHGASHHLNREIFHSCRIEEVVGAVRELGIRFAGQPLALAGFSLGGNFALRVALRAPEREIALSRVVAVCPAIRPVAILDAIESAPWFYHAYFMKKWRGSLKRKASLFPDAYVFDERFLKQRMRELTAELIVRYTEFGTLEDYLDGYSIHGDRLSSLSVPVAILTAEDDPIIPIEDFHGLELPEHVSLDIAPHGGHCGFIRDWSLRSYAEDYLVARLAEMGGAAAVT